MFFILLHVDSVCLFLEGTMNIIKHKKIETTASEKYQIDLFFVKGGYVLLLPEDEINRQVDPEEDTNVCKLTLPTAIASWDQSPEEFAEEVARNLLGIQIHQFDYPLGFQKVSHGNKSITSYALVPSMWKQINTSVDLTWHRPLGAIRDMTVHSKEVMRRYYSRCENEMTFGRYCA